MRPDSGLAARFAAVGAGLSSLLPAWAQPSLIRMAVGGRCASWPCPDFGRCRAGAGRDACDVAVIGSGIGGLTAGALLADRGLRVVVVEQHDRPGGYCHHWLRRTCDDAARKRLLFRFDSGVHDFSGVWPGGPLDVLLKRLGLADAFSWRRVDHRFLFDGLCLDVPRDWRALAVRLGTQFPRDAAGIAGLFVEIRQLHDAIYATGRFHNGVPGVPRTVADCMAFARDHAFAARWLPRSWRELAARHVTDTAALAVIEAIAAYKAHAAAQLTVQDMVTLFGYFIHGGAYPVGGSGRFAQGLADAIEARGGEVRLRTRVQRVLLEDGAARGIVMRDARGRETALRSAAVVCNADPDLLARDLLDDGPARRAVLHRCGAMAPSGSAVAVHLGLRGAVDMPPIVHVKDGDLKMEMVFTAAVDPSCATRGYATADLFELVAPEDAATWFPPDADALRSYRRSRAYLARKRRATARMLDAARRIVPDLDARIVYRSEASPVTFHRYAGTRWGAIYGLKQPSRGLPVKTPVPNLVLAGAATFGSGVEPAAISGAFAAQALVADALGTPARVVGRSPSIIAQGGLHAA